MTLLDWVVLVGTTLFIILYGLVKSRGQKNIEGYFLAGNTLPWYTIALSIISTQASAITFLSAPGQAYADGMRFVLFYLGLPIAMVVLSATVVPLYYKLKVFTAYEFLESRFDAKTRIFTALLFLMQRGLAAGVSIAAPAIVLSVILQWDIFWINLSLGGTVLLYIVTGGSKAVSYTQKLQMITILLGMGIAGYMIVALLPKEVSFYNAIKISAQSGKLNTMDFSFDWENRYNLWTGIIGGFFLQMSYFGTDQSQVGRYLGGSSIAQSRLALLFNGIFKIPMQFCILFIGVMLFVFYQFERPPIFFNQTEISKLKENGHQHQLNHLEEQHRISFEQKKKAIEEMNRTIQIGESEGIKKAKINLEKSENDFRKVRAQLTDLMKKNDAQANTNDTNYIFLSFVTHYLPSGMVGLLIVVIFFASMSTTASELNALTTTCVIDIYKRKIKTNASESHYIRVSQFLLIVWGGIVISFAQLASNLGTTLIEAVNILGSLFYGTILGVFLLAFYVRPISSNAVFVAMILAESIVLMIFFEWFGFKVAYLWLNLIGCLLVMLFAWLVTVLFNNKIGQKFKN